ncbi:MAG: LVIVD repeat-containing protein [Kofleriaceae bacterium]
MRIVGAVVRVVACLAVPLAACGDNHETKPDAQDPGDSCAPTPPALPTLGPLTSPDDLPLPAGCTVGGLRDLPGRWFVRADDNFSFLYPKFEGSCETGFRRANYEDEDPVLSDDGVTFHTWSDGTRIFYRQYYRFNIPGQQDPYEYVSAFAACRMPDGSLAAVQAAYDTDRGPRMLASTGERFAPKDAPSSGLELVGSLGVNGGRPIVGYNVVVDGPHAYVVGPFGLDVIDVSQPATPRLVGHVNGDFNDVKIIHGADQTVAYASAIYSERTTIIDVTVPTSPVARGLLPYSHSVFVQNLGGRPHLYLANYTDGVPIYDASTPLTPVLVGTPPVPGPSAGVHDLFAVGNRIYANHTTAGLVAFDAAGGTGASTERGRVVTPYSHATWVGSIGGRAIVLHGDEGLTPEGGALLRVLDGDSASPTFLDEIARYESRPQVGIHNFQLVGDKVYIAYYQDGVRIVDLADPTQPREVAHYNTWDHEAAMGAPFEGALGIRVVGDLIYVADSERGLMIFREI